MGEHVACVRDMRYEDNIFIGRSRCLYDDDDDDDDCMLTKKGVDWINLAQDRNQ
jgi:hypothetical protein